VAISQETVVLNEFGLSERRRKTSSGTKSRFTVSIRADAIPHVFDAQELGRGPAEAIAKAIGDQIRGVRQTVSEATVLARKAAATAFAAGKEWARGRYAGGRTGPTPPGTGDGLFNDSGRLANGIYAQAVGDQEWTINVPANRFDPSTFDGGVPALQAMIERLQAAVPALRNGESLARIPEVTRAIESSVADIIQSLERQSRQKSLAIARAAIGIVRQLAAGVDLI
jgi:hypothetical protein